MHDGLHVNQNNFDKCIFLPLKIAQRRKKQFYATIINVFMLYAVGCHTNP